MKVEQYYIIITISFKEEGKKWTAHCEELGTAAYGKSLEDAKIKIQEAIDLHLCTLEEVGTLMEFLNENKIKIIKEKPTKNINISIPPNSSILTQSYIPKIHAYC
ncbi:MAG TPA: type II toxin-antitoxin system HicB family antitoxin [Ignavibacteria bacterium]|nr:type II toxin-antitoxin system HicB family antitoxin [Ignavibacteria bacterium]